MSDVRLLGGVLQEYAIHLEEAGDDDVGGYLSDKGSLLIGLWYFANQDFAVPTRTDGFFYNVASMLPNSWEVELCSLLNVKMR